MTNKHETPRNQAIAEPNTILRVQVGSGLHGTNIKDQDDRDEMGICIEPPEYVIGLGTFEQWQDRRHADGTRIGDGERSGPGDLDLVVYSLRKWTRLAAQGNPTVLLMLWAPPQEQVVSTSYGIGLQNRAEMFLSRECGKRFQGYLKSQREQLLGMRGKHTNRPELIDQFGFDTKFAYHAIRLGIQGCELLSTGKVTLPMDEEDRNFLKALRVGDYTKEEALHSIEYYDAQLRDLMVKTKGDWPDKPDMARINTWLMATYRSWWSR